MTNKEAMEIVIQCAEHCGTIGVAVAKKGSEEKILEAVYQMQDYYNDVMED